LVVPVDVGQADDRVFAALNGVKLLRAPLQVSRINDDMGEGSTWLDSSG
jgi:hypothetical protein